VTLIEVPSEDYEAASADLVAAGFDLETDAPLRLILTSGSDADHRLTVVAHHIALDGLSFATIVSDLISAYDARADGRSPIWPSPALIRLLLFPWTDPAGRTNRRRLGT
jgi:glutamate racemase